MMTSFAFILGVVPLVVAHGAGAEMRRTLGTAVFSGMLGVTLFGILLTPVFFFVIDRIAGMRLFSSGRLHDASELVLDALSLGFLRRLVRTRLARASAAKTKSASASFCREALPSAVSDDVNRQLVLTSSIGTHQTTNDEIEMTRAKSTGG
jgi:hypothetical protein